MDKMAKKIKLSDLVMMQMVGGLEEFISLATSGKETDTHISNIKGLATTPKIFEDIIKKTISTQLGDALTSLRELGQNARDAYNPDDKEKIINFSAETEHIGSSNITSGITVRDYGIGMKPDELFSLFLIPYNSGKEFDSTKIGEHGIGFFTSLDISKEISIKTQKMSGLTTKLKMYQENKDWYITYEFLDEKFKGTEISIQFSNPIKNNLVYQTLLKNLGFLDSGFLVSYNGKKLNIMPKFYSEIGTSNIVNKGESKKIRVGFADEWLDSSFNKVSQPDNLVMTQEGLHIKNFFVPELIKDDILADLVYRIIDFGYNLWVELPNNVGLTKGRNNIIARDTGYVEKAATEAFSKGILEKILEDEELVYKLDTQIADVVNRALKSRTNQKPFDWKSIPRVLVSIPYVFVGMYNFLADTEINISFKNSKLNLSRFRKSEMPPDKADEEMIINARKRRYLKVYKYKNIEAFSTEIINKKMISGVIYQGKESFKTKVSVNDIIDYYCRNTLYLYEPEKDFPKKGLVVKQSNPIVKTVVEYLTLQDMINGRNDFSLDLREVWASLFKKKYDSEDSLWERLNLFVSSIKEGFKTSNKNNFNFNNKRKHNFEEIVKNYSVGQEYVALFENIKYIDNLVSKANNLEFGNIRLFGRRYSFVVAETNLFSTGFNVYSDTVKKYIQSISQGGYSEDTLKSLVELVIHEKAHDKMGMVRVSGDHGKEFYNITKKQLRERLFDYCKKEGIELYKEINQNLKPINMKKLKPEEIRKLL